MTQSVTIVPITPEEMVFDPNMSNSILLCFRS